MRRYRLPAFVGIIGVDGYTGVRLCAWVMSQEAGRTVCRPAQLVDRWAA